MKSWTVLGVCALLSAAVTARRRAVDAKTLAEREIERCERLFRGLDARLSNFR